MPVTRQGENDAITLESIQAMIDRAIQRNSTHTQDDASQNSGGEPRRPVQPARGTPKKKLTDKYYPKGEIKKLEIELWNLKVRGNDVAAYTQRFQEIALMCTKFLADEIAKVDKYISGLPNNIHGNVMSVRPKTLDEAIELANDLMDQKLRTYVERQPESKRKFDNNNQAQQIPKRQNVAQSYAVGTGERKEYAGTLPLCNKCKFHHNGPCSTKCAICKKVSHLTRDCWNPTATNNQKTITFFECGNQGHQKSDYPELKNQKH
uniref:Reverse transcriptase domain-containing protein n=1 Tax=Tanacetum cinerariifolium TaxID=118510 RepID=A0A6L2L326_TANCI|nr:reverse transcriptase domain-containing protein [Tanacetum cinerariifolium]